MKKEIIICFIVVAIVIALNVISEAHTDLVMNSTEEKLEILRRRFI